MSYIDKCSKFYALLSEAVKSIGNYSARKRYVIEELIPRNKTINEEELAIYLGITLGEATILLREVRLWYNEVEEEVMLSRSFKPNYERAALGGTFDRPHVGHIALLNVAFRSAKRVLIGVTSDELVGKLDKRHPVLSFEERINGLKQLLKRYGWYERSEICKLYDALGPPANEPDFDLLVVSPFTQKRGEEINKERVRKGYKPLNVEISPLVLAEDGEPVSTTRIYNGEIDEHGRIIRGRRQEGLGRL